MLKCYRAVIVFAGTCVTVSAHDLPQYLDNRIEFRSTRDIISIQLEQV